MNIMIIIIDINRMLFGVLFLRNPTRFVISSFVSEQAHLLSGYRVPVKYKALVNPNELRETFYNDMDPIGRLPREEEFLCEIYLATEVF
jgi:hypothetical protein